EGQERSADRGARDDRAGSPSQARRDPGDRDADQVLADAPGRSQARPASGRAHRRSPGRVRLLARGDRLAPSEKSGPVGHQGAATRRAGLALIVLAGCCCLAAPAAGDLYRWTDAEGTVHYTADLASIPPTFRDTATPLNTPQAPPIPPPTANEPVALKVSPGAPITVEARLNGVGLTLIVDTGADRTVISPEVIERAGLAGGAGRSVQVRSEEHTSELQSHLNLVCRLLLEKNKRLTIRISI